MTLFMIHEEKCNRDGICARECPVKIIHFNPGQLPEPDADAEELCINCGHCTAVCPTGAFSLKTMPQEECRPIKKDLFISPDQAEQLICGRRSVRVYKNKPVERETLNRLLEMARYAPSGHNSQTVHWLVVYDTEQLRNLTVLVAEWMRQMIRDQHPLAQNLNLSRFMGSWDKGYDFICRNAPHLIVAHAPKSDPVSVISCTIALSHLELAAPPLGLGTCWAGFFNLGANFWPPLHEALKLPEGHGSFGAMMIGYPKFAYHRIPLRNPAKVQWM